MHHSLTWVGICLVCGEERVKDMVFVNVNKHIC